MGLTSTHSSTENELAVRPIRTPADYRWVEDVVKPELAGTVAIVSQPLHDLLSTYQPRSDAERVDLERLRQLVSSGDPWPRSTPLHATGSALIVHPPSRRVLLRWHARQQAWLQVGGHADAGESDPFEIALREGAEETGLPDLRPWPDTSLVHVVIVPVPAAAHEPAHEHADLRFVLATQHPDRARPESVGAKLKWLSLDQARELNTEDNLHETFRRLEALMGQH
jgi:8-oxo-dGTP pyrophosphatase MutT (NUDIX family)